MGIYVPSSVYSQTDVFSECFGVLHYLAFFSAVAHSTDICKTFIVYDLFFVE